MVFNELNKYIRIFSKKKKKKIHLSTYMFKSNSNNDYDDSSAFFLLLLNVDKIFRMKIKTADNFTFSSSEHISPPLLLLNTYQTLRDI